VLRAKRLRIAPIVLQTNGAKLDAHLAKELVSAGLDAVHLSIHGGDARVHDYHTDKPGSFVRVLAAFDVSRSAGLTVFVTTVVTRSNFRVLSPIVPLVRERGASAWRLAFPETSGRAAQSADRVVPRYGLAVPYALHAMDAARRVGLAAVISSVPDCLLGPFASRALNEAPRAFLELCDDCDAREGCAGVDPHYLARFGGDEFSKVVRTRRDDRVDELAPLFAGPGELSRAAPVASASAPKERRALPMLGRVKPALAEAPPNAVRRSGEALREIFPALFGVDPEGRTTGPK
jgi:hypothetical protein